MTKRRKDRRLPWQLFTREREPEVKRTLFRGGREVGEAVSLGAVELVYPGADSKALDQVSLTIDPGEFVYLIGSSGSGKSSLLRLLYAEQKATAGRVWVAGVNVTRLRGSRTPLFRRKLGVVFQDFKLLDNRTVYEQVAFALTVLGRRGDAEVKVPEVLELVGLLDKGDRLPGELSGGEQQRVAIARALVADPVMLVADEPTGNLDPDTARSVLDVFERVNAAGMTVLMATHDQNLVDRSGHRVVEMAGGRIVRDSVGGYRDGAGE